MVLISELYGKKVISTTGHWVGEVHHIVIDLENGSVSHLLLGKIDSNTKGEMIRALFKNSVTYDKIKKIADTVVVSPQSS